MGARLGASTSGPGREGQERQAAGRGPLPRAMREQSSVLSGWVPMCRTEVGRGPDPTPSGLSLFGDAHSAWRRGRKSCRSRPVCTASFARTRPPAL